MSYRSVTELSNKELYQLKEDLYYDLVDLGCLTIEELNEVQDAFFPEDISDQIVFKVFAHTDFVTEDFFCNI